MHAWADSSTRAVAGMISLFTVAGRVIRGEFGVLSEAFGNERSGVGVVLRVHVHAPGVDYNYAAFGQEFAVDPVVWSVFNSLTLRNLGDLMFNGHASDHIRYRYISTSL